MRQLPAVAVALAVALTPALAVEPVEHVYATHGGTELKAYVFTPDAAAVATRPAIVILHGGGWSIGSAEWGFGRAEHFARQGLVAISGQYRLSDMKTITPLDAIEDAKALIRWVRSNAAKLGVDPARVAGYGWSAGGHLLACAAIFDDASEAGGVSSAPDALVLVSPAVWLAREGYVKRLLLGRSSPEAISPHLNVRARLPPTLVLQGRTDTVTPLGGAQRFCERMLEEGNRCELIVYDGVGHLFTPSSEPDDGWPNPDEKVRAAAYRKADAFLAELGYVD